MAQSRGYQAQQRGSGRPARPWNVYYPRNYNVQREGGQGSEERTDFIRVGAAFKLREREGLTCEIHLPLTLEPGTRLVIMPPKDESE